MANTYITLDDLFAGIADAIRLKNGSTGVIVADTFPDEIRDLKTGFDYNNHNVSAIEDYQFKNCTDLRNVDCYSVTNIGTSAFEGCTELESVVLYNGVQSVGENAFKGCDCIIYCETVSKPDGWHESWNPDNCEVVWGLNLIKTWDISATKNDNVIAKLYNDIHNEGHYSLILNGNGNMEKYDEMPNTPNCEIPWENYCEKITKIILSTGVTNIGDYAFCYCTSLTSVTIPDSVTNIGNRTFYGCSFQSITIPDSVTSMGIGVLQWCTSLTSINYTGTVAQWNAIILGSGWNSKTGNYTIHCTDGDIAKDGTITYHTSGGDN